MTRRIDIKINQKGEILTNYAGFCGEDCYLEADKLNKLLLALGVVTRPVEVRPKGPDTIALELSDAEEAKKKVEAGPG